MSRGGNIDLEAGGGGAGMGLPQLPSFRPPQPNPTPVANSGFGGPIAAPSASAFAAAPQYGYGGYGAQQQPQYAQPPFPPQLQPQPQGFAQPSAALGASIGLNANVNANLNVSGPAPPSTPLPVGARITAAAQSGGGPRTVHELLSSSEQLKQYIAAFIEAGVDDLPFLLGETRAQWDQALDHVRDIARRTGIELRIGHRMQIISLLQREQARLEELTRPTTAGASPGAQPPLMRDATSPGRRAPRQDMLANPTEVTSEGEDMTICLLACNKVLGAGRGHWVCCMVFGVVLLLGSVLLEQMYSNLKDNDYNDSQPAPSGAWQFVRLLYIFGFTACSVMFCCCGWLYCRNPNQRAMECPDACKGSPSAAPTCPTCPACELPHCACDVPALDCKCSTPACDMPSCSIPACDCDLPRPSCSCDCLPDCSGIGDCFATVYKIVCCQCKIQVG